MGNAAEENHERYWLLNALRTGLESPLAVSHRCQSSWKEDELKMLSNSDLKTRGRKRAWRQISRECNKLYMNITACTDERLITAVDERRIGDNLTIYEMIPPLPSMEYKLYYTSCIIQPQLPNGHWKLHSLHLRHPLNWLRVRSLHMPTLSMGQRRRLLRLWIHKRHPWWRREARHWPGKGLRQTHGRTGDSKEES